MLRRGFLWRVGELGLSEWVTGTLGQGVVSGEGGASKDMRSRGSKGPGWWARGGDSGVALLRPREGRKR